MKLRITPAERYSRRLSGGAEGFTSILTILSRNPHPGSDAACDEARAESRTRASSGAGARCSFQLQPPSNPKARGGARLHLPARHSPFLCRRDQLPLTGSEATAAGIRFGNRSDSTPPTLL